MYQNLYNHKIFLNFNTLFIITASSLLIGCSTRPVSTATSANSIYINSTHDLKDCKYLGIVEAVMSENWKKDLRNQAADSGATHIVTSGPNNVTGNSSGETIQGNIYFCKE